MHAIEKLIYIFHHSKFLKVKKIWKAFIKREGIKEFRR